jgi:hypothetical protein
VDLDRQQVAFNLPVALPRCRMCIHRFAWPQRSAIETGPIAPRTGRFDDIILGGRRGFVYPTCHSG